MYIFTLDIKVFCIDEFILHFGKMIFFPRGDGYEAVRKQGFHDSISSWVVCNKIVTYNSYKDKDSLYGL